MQQASQRASHKHQSFPLSKKEWGPRGWNWLHLTAINYAPDIMLLNGRTIFLQIWNFINNLPCEECQKHSAMFILRNPPCLSSSYSLQSWVWKFHNDVNFHLGKPYISYEEYQRIYADEIMVNSVKILKNKLSKNCF